ncbi:MAG: hypothetical protein ABF617_01220 [Gluconobacter japonicus]|uniref:NADH-quinone oxidoreductase subunit D-related protein n=2 Tax=Gluconobacter japonicus TaxID=376620 RepID=UPI0039ED7EA8
MSDMGKVIRSGERVALSHYSLDAEQWEAMLAAPGATLPLLSCWADEHRVYVLLLKGDCPLMASTAVEDRRYLAPSSRFPAAEWGERVAYDLWGVEAMGASGEGQPALDEGVWEATWPLSSRPGPGGQAARPVPGRTVLPAEKSGLTGPLELSFDVARGKVQGVSVNAGLAHRGVLHRMIGLTPEEALPLVSRMTAGGFVAHPVAFCRAVAQARGLQPGPGVRDCWMILLEIERMSVHLFDMARTARAVDAGLLATHCEHAREAIAFACAEQGVSRRLTDLVRCDGFRAGLEIVPLAQAVVNAMQSRMAQLRELQSVFAPRLKGLAVLAPTQAREFAVGGLVGRASGRSLDVRRREAGMRLDALRSTGSSEGDGAARDALRLNEIRDSLALIQRILGSIGMDDDEPAPEVTQEGIGAAEGARGDIWYWVRLRHGKIEAVQVRDPAVSLLSVLPDILKGELPEDLPAALRSLALSPSGVAM